MSLVRVMPTIFCRRAEPPEPGIWPSFCSGSAYCAGLRDDAEVAGERDLEADAEAIAAVGGDHRLGAAGRRGDVPGELGDVLGARLHEALDVAARGEMLARRRDSTMTRTRRILVEGLEHQPELVALRHRDDVEGGRSSTMSARSRCGVDLDAEAVEIGETGIGEAGGLAHDVLRCRI